MTKSLFADWSNPNCNGLNEKSAPEYIKVVITTQNEKSAQPVKRHPSSHVPDCINKRG
jgi:hypothetical protein